jgi:hypothetical protein
MITLISFVRSPNGANHDDGNRYENRHSVLVSPSIYPARRTSTTMHEQIQPLDGYDQRCLALSRVLAASKKLA